MLLLIRQQSGHLFPFPFNFFFIIVKFLYSELILFGFGFEIIDHFSKQSHGEEAALLVLSDQPVGEKVLFTGCTTRLLSWVGKSPSFLQGRWVAASGSPVVQVQRPWKERGHRTKDDPSCVLTPGSVL